MEKDIFKTFNYELKDAKSEQECFDDCVNLLANLKENLKSKNFSEDWLSKLIYWQMAKNNIEQIKVEVKAGKLIPRESNNTFTFSKELLDTKKIKDFAEYTDTILHLFNYAVFDKNNMNIKKDINGNLDGKFVQKFSFYVSTFLKNNSKLAKETIDDVTLGMFFCSESDKIAHEQANLQSMELFETARDRSDSYFKRRFLTKAVNCVNKIKDKYNPDKFECVDAYKKNMQDIKDVSIDYQKNHEIITDDDYYYLNIARQIYQSDQLDQNSFYKLLLRKKFNYAKEFLDDLTFKNSPKNIEHFKWTLAEHNIDISSVKLNNFKENYLLNKEDIKQKSQEKLTQKQEKQVEKGQEKPTQKEESKEKTKSFDKENISQEEHEKEM